MLEGAVLTLVVAAYPPELERLLSLARADVELRAIGVGLVEAAAGAERALIERRPDRVVFVGTAGVLPGHAHAIGDIVVAESAALAVRPVEYVPPILPTRVAADAAWAHRLAKAVGAPLATVVSPLGITQDDVEAARLAETAAVEHLETFALLAAAARAQVPATALLAIANSVGSRGAAEWRQHRVAAESAAQSALARALAAL